MLLEVGLAEVIMREPKIRIHFDGLPALLYRFVIRMCKGQKLRQIGIDNKRKRIQAFRFSHFREGFVIAVQKSQMPSVPMMSRGVTRVQFNRTQKFIAGRIEIPVEAIEGKKQASYVLRPSVLSSSRALIAAAFALGSAPLGVIPHTVVSTDKVFKSKVLDTDEKFSCTFTQAGSFPYFCSIHPKMTGKVVVK